jgi:hypothetical protein
MKDPTGHEGACHVLDTGHPEGFERTGFLLEFIPRKWGPERRALL